MTVPEAHQTIHAAVTAWDGIETHPHRFGGAEYRLGRREIGHVHGDDLVDIPFPVKVRQEVVAAGLAQPHHILPESGWVSIFLRQSSDVEHAITLLHRSYQLAIAQRSKSKA